MTDVFGCYLLSCSFFDKLLCNLQSDTSVTEVSLLKNLSTESEFFSGKILTLTVYIL